MTEDYLSSAMLKNINKSADIISLLRSQTLREIKPLAHMLQTQCPVQTLYNKNWFSETLYEMSDNVNKTWPDKVIANKLEHVYGNVHAHSKI